MSDLVKKYKKNMHEYEKLTKWAEKQIQKITESYKPKIIGIESRTKNIASLEKKLQQLKINKLNKIQDLSGVRITTILEKDSYQIILKIRDYFGKQNVDYIPKYSKNNYNSDHLIITVPIKFSKGKKNTRKGKKFEVQVTSALFSMWARLGHDLIYKDQHRLKQFNESFYQSLNKKFEDLMANHLKPLTDELDVIDSMVVSQVNGQSIQNNKNLRKLADENNLKNLYSGLVDVRESIRAIGNQTTAPFTLTNLIQEVINKLDKVQYAPQDSSFDYIVSCCTDLLYFIHPTQLDLTVTYGINLEKLSKKPWIAKSLKDAITQITELNLGVRRSFGVSCYSKALQVCLKNIKENGFCELTQSILRNFSKMEFDNSYFDGESFQISKPLLEIDTDLISLRDAVLDGLFELYPNLSLPNRLVVIELSKYFHEYTVGFQTTPQAHDEALRCFDKSTNYLKLLQQKMSVLEKQQIINNIERSNNLFKKKSMKESRKVLRAIRKDKLFKIYSEITVNKKTFLIGGLSEELKDHYSSFFAKYDSYKKINKLLLTIISLFPDISSMGTNRATQGISLFFAWLGESKQPDVMSFLERNPSGSFDYIEYPFLLGLSTAGMSSYVCKKSKNYIAVHCESVCQLLMNSDITDQKVFSKAFNQARKQSSQQALNSLLICAVKNSPDDAQRNKNVIRVSRSLKRLKYDLSLFFIYGRFEDNFKLLSIKAVSEMLQLLLLKKKLGNEDDLLLSWAAELHPTLVVDFFVKRLNLESKWSETDGLFKTFEAIPHNSYWIEQSSLKDSIEGLQQALSCVSKTSSSVYSCAELINKIWPDKEDEITEHLLNFSKKNKKTKLKSIRFLGFLDNKNVHIRFIEKFIIAFADWKDFESSLAVLALKRGVVMGEEGFIRANDEDILFARERANSSTGDIKKFWKSIETGTKKEKSLEHRRVDKNRAKRKLIYGK